MTTDYFPSNQIISCCILSVRDTQVFRRSNDWFALIGSMDFELDSLSMCTMQEEGRVNDWFASKKPLDLVESILSRQSSFLVVSLLAILADEMLGACKERLLLTDNAFERKRLIHDPYEKAGTRRFKSGCCKAVLERNACFMPSQQECSDQTNTDREREQTLLEAGMRLLRAKGNDNALIQTDMNDSDSKRMLALRVFSQRKFSDSIRPSLLLRKAMSTLPNTAE